MIVSRNVPHQQHTLVLLLSDNEIEFYTEVLILLIIICKKNILLMIVVLFARKNLKRYNMYLKYLYTIVEYPH